jgi:hypothetical protein
MLRLMRALLAHAAWISLFPAAAALPQPAHHQKPPAHRLQGHSEPRSVPLALAGRAVAVVVLPAQPRPAELAAGHEFVRLVRRISGASLPIANGTAGVGTSHRSLVFIGNVSSALTQAGLGGLAGSLLPEGSAVATGSVTTTGGSASTPALFLVGDDYCQPHAPGGKGSPTSNGPCRTGTLFGVVRFFREQFGCEWLWPGEVGEVVPNDPDLAVPAISTAERRPLAEPPLLRRYRAVYSNGARTANWQRQVPWAYNASVVAKLAVTEVAWLHTAMMMGSHEFPDTGHAFGGWWDADHIKHPEWFALLPANTTENPGPVAIRGPPRWHASDTSWHISQVKMCVSNSEVWSELVHNHYHGGPGLSACEDDGAVGFCQCPKCKAWDRPGQGMGRDRGGAGNCTGLTAAVLGNCTGSYSDRYAQFWTSIAGEVAKAHPENTPWVTGYAYETYQQPPQTAKLVGKIMVGIVAFSGYPSLPNETAAGQRIWSGWHDAGARGLFLRPNIGGDTVGHGPYEFSEQVTTNVNWAAKRGLVGADFDSLYGHWATSGFSYWALAMSLWQPESFDRTAALAHWAARAFGGNSSVHGSAAAAGVAYINFWEEFTTRTFTNATVRAIQNEGPKNLGRLKVTPMVYTEQVLRQGGALLQVVADRCGGYRGCAERVAFIGSGLQHANLTAAAITAVAEHTGSPWYSTSCFGGGRACALHGVLPAASALLALRRRIAPTGAINVLSVTASEGPVPGHDLAGQGLASAADLVAAAAGPGGGLSLSVLLPTLGWTIVLDPGDVGLGQHWEQWPSALQNNTYAGPAAVGRPWNSSAAAVAWSTRHGNRTYAGVAWYFTAGCAGWPTTGKRNVLAMASAGGDTAAFLSGVALRRAGASIPVTNLAVRSEPITAPPINLSCVVARCRCGHCF